MKPGTALITGSSSGIGLHLAHEFARNGHDLVLVAPVAQELNDLAQEIISQTSVHIHVIAKDLENPDSAREIFDEVQALGLTIEILVNNAGHGMRGQTWEIPLETDLSMIRLNIEAPLRLTKLFLPPMIARGHGTILNTASVAGFEPGPMLNVYHSTKAFLLSWSEALSVELEKTGVQVTALCPGPTDTDFFAKANMQGVRGFQQAQVMSPQSVAKIAYEGLIEGDMLVVPGGVNKALVVARRVLTEEAQARLNRKFYEEVPIEKQTRQRGDIEREAAAQDRVPA